MKILFLQTKIDYSGASKILTWVANCYADAGHEVVILTYRDDVEHQILSPTVKHEHIKLEYGNFKIVQIISSVLSLRKYLKKYQFDIAFAFLSPSQIRLIGASLFLKTKVIFSQRGDPYYGSNKLLNYIYRLADKCVFQTKQARDYYPVSVKKKSVIIPNFIEDSGIPWNGERKKTIVNVARLDIKQKRQDLLIEAFSKIAMDYPEYVLQLYGTGEDEKQLRKLAEPMGERIQFMGLSRNIYRDIKNASLFVLSSDFEGIPNALLEAMSMGLPCISTDCSPGGAKLLIQNGINGLLVDRNKPKKLEAAMRYMLENREEAEKMAKNAVKVKYRFAPEVIAKCWLELLKEFDLY